MTRRRIALLGSLIPMLFALSACNAGSQVVVHPDGSGTFSTVMTVEGKAGDALYASVVDAGARSAVPMTVSRYTAGAESGARISVPFQSLKDLSALGDSLGASTGLGGVAVARAASGWTFVARSDGGLVRPPGAAAGPPGGQIDGSQLAGMVHMSVTVELPGAPGRTNADTVTPAAATTRFVWNLKAGRVATDLSARTTFVGDQRSVALATTLTTLRSVTAAPPVRAASNDARTRGIVAAVAVAVLLAGAGGLLILRRRRARRRAAPGDAGA